ncbi:MAG: DUF1902 domain-containing protein [Gammaproteobacteria bacterium]|nr:DUF1902 domain-containing protein [Gammaproteobacteria bacterium]
MAEQSYFRCFTVRQPEGYWEAYCIDLSLAARGDTPDAAQQAMLAQVEDYLAYVQSLPKDEQSRFLSRKAPMEQRLQFRWVRLRTFFRRLVGSDGKRFSSQGSAFELTLPKAA